MDLSRPPGVSCPVHGVVVVSVPWARHGAGHTMAFDDTLAWLAVATAKSTVCELLRIAWRTVGAIITRVADEATAARDPLVGLRRVGIHEISYSRKRTTWTRTSRRATLALRGPLRGPCSRHVAAILSSCRRAVPRTMVRVSSRVSAAVTDSSHKPMA